MKYIYITILQMLVLIVSGQGNFKKITKDEAVAILRKTNAWYSSTATYSFTLTHATYVGHTATIPYDQKTGYYRKLSNGFHSKVLGVHTIQNKDYRISLDSTKKIIVVSNAPQKATGFSAEEYSQALTKCVSIKQAEEKDGAKIIRMEFGKNFPIAQYDLQIDAEGKLSFVQILYAHEAKSTDGVVAKPKLTIKFEHYTTTVNNMADELNTGRYLLASGKQLKLTQAYEGFRLLDQRITTEP